MSLRKANTRNVVDLEAMRQIATKRGLFYASFLTFVKTFYKFRTGRDFNLSHPLGRESHYITIARVLERVIRNECRRLIINVPPRYGKTELLIHFVSWALARYPDSNFIYVSYAHSLAKKQTQTIRNIIQMPEYEQIFDVKLKEDTTAKDNFETTKGGCVYAVGAGGGITGRGAGINSSKRFGGCIVIDDIIKPDEATSDTIRESINEWYYNTLQSRTNSPNTPIIIIGQRVHEYDLAAKLMEDPEWETLIIPAIDEAGNALHPQMHDLKALRKMQDESPYNFAAQYQQNPQPSGGGIFKPDWFPLFELAPTVLDTFITCDTAETDKDYNDPSVFSFWGIHRIMHRDTETDIFGLYWLDCLEVRVEPKDLEHTFMNFYARCMMHKVKPQLIAIEKKSTGVTLASVLKSLQGLQIRDIERSKASGSKTSRFLEMQPYIASKRVSFPENGKHTNMCVEHLRKITANNTHRFDDIADTLYDAVKLALIDEVIIRRVKNTTDHRAASIGAKLKQLNRIKGNTIYDYNRSPFG